MDMQQMAHHNPIVRKEKEGVVWLEFPLLQSFPTLVHGVFLRHGGKSQGSHATLNVGKCVGDDLAAIDWNVGKIKEIVAVSKFICGKQVHGDYIHHYTGGPREISDCDGLITQEKNVGLFIKHADCQAALFFDPVHQAIGCVHSGWRGSVKNIYAKTVDAMVRAFGTKPEELRVCISPSLGPESAEFKNYRDELPEAFWTFQTKPTYFDFWAISRHQLETCGIRSEHIQIAGICTLQNPQDYYSYRREKLSGRHATVIGLK